MPDSEWTLVFMDENNRLFHREPIVPGMPLPESPQWRIAINEKPMRLEAIQFLEIPGWIGDEQITTRHTIVNYGTKEYVVAVHGIYKGVN